MSETDRLLQVLAAVAEGRLPLADAREAVVGAREDLGFATIDHDREARCGFPEVVLAQGKTPAEAAEIAARIFRRSGRVLVTRASPLHATAVSAAVPGARYHERARIIRADESPRAPIGRVVVACAGTADLPTAEEAAHTAEALGAATDRVFDVGVAGLGRTLAALDRLRAAHAIVVVAGMDGALPSVIGGLVAVPVFAVPTSVGYGASFGGVAALLGMLNSCAPNVSTLNIDNGFGAGYQAALVNRSAVGAGRGE